MEVRMKVAFDARRIVASLLLIIGFLLMLLAPEDLIGLILIGLGIVIELIGLALRNDESLYP